MKFFRPPHMLEFLCAGTDAYNRFALEAGRAIDNKKDLSTSKLVSSPLLLSAPLIYVRAVPCPDRRSVHTRCRALCSFIKKHRNSSKLDSCVLYSFAHCACSPRLLWLLADVCENTTIYIEDVSVNCI